MISNTCLKFTDFSSNLCDVPGLFQSVRNSPTGKMPSHFPVQSGNPGDYIIKRLRWLISSADMLAEIRFIYTYRLCYVCHFRDNPVNLVL